MREFTTPLLVEPSHHRNATDLLMQQFRTNPGHVAAILADADVRLAIGGTAEHAVLLEGGFEEAGMPGLGVWTMAARPGADLADLEAGGAGIPTMKLKRAAFAERTQDIVDTLYAQPRSQA